MLESFKLTAQKLKRYLKVHVNLPQSYRSTNKSYPLVLSFDGQYFFNFIKEDTKKANIDDIINKYEIIFIAIQSPSNELWRESELNPYYNGKEKQIDKVLSYIFFEYLMHDLIPMFKERYRISSDLYVMGYGISAIASLYMVNKYPEVKGAAVFCPDFTNVDNNLINDLDIHHDKTKEIYLYKGERKTNYDELFYNIYLKYRKYEYEYVVLDYTDEANDVTCVSNHLNTFLNFITEK